jgi:hypothetical protein
MGHTSHKSSQATALGYVPKLTPEGVKVGEGWDVNVALDRTGTMSGCAGMISSARDMVSERVQWFRDLHRRASSSFRLEAGPHVERRASIVSPAGRNGRNSPATGPHGLIVAFFALSCHWVTRISFPCRCRRDPLVPITRLTPAPGQMAQGPPLHSGIPTHHRPPRDLLPQLPPLLVILRFPLHLRSGSTPIDLPRHTDLRTHRRSRRFPRVRGEAVSGTRSGTGGDVQFE